MSVPDLLAALDDAIRDGELSEVGKETWYVRRARDGRWYGHGRNRWVGRIDDARNYKTLDMARRGAERMAHDRYGGDMEVIRVVPIPLSVDHRATCVPSHYGQYANGWSVRLRVFLRAVEADAEWISRSGTVDERALLSCAWGHARKLPEVERPTEITLTDGGQIVYDEGFRERIDRLGDKL